MFFITILDCIYSRKIKKSYEKKSSYRASYFCRRYSEKTGITQMMRYLSVYKKRRGKITNSHYFDQVGSAKSLLFLEKLNNLE